MLRSSSLTSFILEQRVPWHGGDWHVSGTKGRFDEAAIIRNGIRRSCSLRAVSPLGAILNGQVGVANAELVSVELATGQRQLATIDLSTCGEARVRFSQPVDMLALINRTLLNQPSERRSMPRLELRCPVRLKWGGNTLDPELCNISAGGLQLRGGSLLQKAPSYLLSSKG